MSSTVAPIEIEQLTRDQKLALIDALWISVFAESDHVLTPEQLEDLDARLEYRRQHPDKGSTWEEVKARLMSEQ
jgi:putative addiction module component (TIGR02574 family)